MKECTGGDLQPPAQTELSQRRAHSHISPLLAQLLRVHSHLFQHCILKILAKAQEPHTLIEGKERRRGQGSSEIGQTGRLRAFNDLVTGVDLQIPAQKVQNHRNAQQLARSHPVRFRLRGFLHSIVTTILLLLLLLLTVRPLIARGPMDRGSVHDVQEWRKQEGTRHVNGQVEYRVESGPRRCPRELVRHHAGEASEGDAVRPGQMSGTHEHRPQYERDTKEMNDLIPGFAMIDTVEGHGARGIFKFVGRFGAEKEHVRVDKMGDQEAQRRLAGPCRQDQLFFACRGGGLGNGDHGAISSTEQ